MNSIYLTIKLRHPIYFKTCFYQFRPMISSIKSLLFGKKKKKTCTCTLQIIFSTVLGRRMTLVVYFFPINLLKIQENSKTLKVNRKDID